MIVRIDVISLQMPELQVYTGLSENELRTYYEPEGGLFIAESPKVILRALAAGYVPESLLVEACHVEGEASVLLQELQNRDLGFVLPVYVADSKVLEQLPGFAMTRGALSVMRRLPLPKAEEICRGARRIAVLDHVVNPTNVGAIFRSAAALGMDGILLTEDCSNPLYRRAARVSVGTVFQIPWTVIPTQNLNALMHGYGYKTVAMALREESFRIGDPELLQHKRLAILLGNEGDGLPQEVIDGCDYTVMIPMSHGVDSLNVAAASAVAFYELGQNRMDLGQAEETNN